MDIDALLSGVIGCPMLQGRWRLVYGAGNRRGAQRLPTYGVRCRAVPATAAALQCSEMPQKRQASLPGVKCKPGIWSIGIAASSPVGGAKASPDKMAVVPSL